MLGLLQNAYYRRLLSVSEDNGGETKNAAIGRLQQSQIVKTTGVEILSPNLYSIANACPASFGFSLCYLSLNIIAFEAMYL